MLVPQKGWVREFHKWAPALGVVAMHSSEQNVLRCEVLYEGVGNWVDNGGIFFFFLKNCLLLSTYYAHDIFEFQLFLFFFKTQVSMAEGTRCIWQRKLRMG